MKLYGTVAGSAIWALIGVGTAILAFSQQNQMTALIAAGWIMIATFSYLESQKESSDDDLTDSAAE